MTRDMGERGQTSLEFLLLLAGLIVFVAILAGFFKGMLRDTIWPEAKHLAQETADKFD